MANDPQAPHRVALYYAPPPQSAWWRAGSEWLGRCALTGQPLPQPVITGMAPGQFAALTADPRRYGWHATLKAPFRLAPGQTLDSLRAGVRQLCEGREPFDLAPLQVSHLGHFLALRPLHAQPELDTLAADCVRQIHPLAMPLSPDELARRRRAPLTPEQDALLQAWGYPYVLDQYRFHLSLTGALQALPADTLAGLLEAAADRFHDLPPCRIDRISVFVEPTPGADFCLLEQIGFQP
jgi:putative phosphonate metabolism protein